MASKFNIDTVEKDSAEENLRVIRSKKNINTDKMDNNGMVKCMVH